MDLNTNHQQILTIALVLLLLGNLAATFVTVQKVNDLDQQLDSVTEEQKALGDMLIGEAANSNNSGGEFATPTNATASTIFIGYDSEAGEAKIVPIETTRLPEQGFYTNIENVDIKKSVQESWRRGEHLISQTQYDPPGKGILIEFHTPKVWDFVTGGSSALPAAAAIAATNPKVEMNNSIALTGGLDQYGRITPVRGVKAKAIAAREVGKDVLVVPPGDKQDVDGIEVKEARTLGQALRIALITSEDSSQGDREGKQTKQAAMVRSSSYRRSLPPVRSRYNRHLSATAPRHEPPQPIQLPLFSSSGSPPANHSSKNLD